MFTKGQTVVVVSGGMRSGRGLQVVTIKNVWKNGVVEIDPGDLYNPDGYRRGPRALGFHTSSSIRPLLPEETAESVRAAISAKAATAGAESDQKAKEHKAGVEAWWRNTGQAIWAARYILPKRFMGEVASIIRFEQNGEQHLTLVVVKDADGSEYIVTSSGLMGEDHSKKEGWVGDKKTISAYSYSVIRADSFQEALYRLCH